MEPKYLKENCLCNFVSFMSNPKKMVIIDFAISAAYDKWFNEQALCIDPIVIHATPDDPYKTFKDIYEALDDFTEDKFRIVFADTLRHLAAENASSKAKTYRICRCEYDHIDVKVGKEFEGMQSHYQFMYELDKYVYLRDVASNKKSHKGLFIKERVIGHLFQVKPEQIQNGRLLTLRNGVTFAVSLEGIIDYIFYALCTNYFTIRGN